MVSSMDGIFTHSADDEAKHPGLDTAGDDVIARQSPPGAVQDAVSGHVLHQIRQQHRCTNTWPDSVGNCGMLDR